MGIEEREEGTKRSSFKMLTNQSCRIIDCVRNEINNHICENENYEKENLEKDYTSIEEREEGSKRSSFKMLTNQSCKIIDCVRNEFNHLCENESNEKENFEKDYTRIFQNAMKRKTW